MKKFLLLVKIIATIGTGIFITGCKNKKTDQSTTNTSIEHTDTSKTMKPTDNHYQDLRNLALNITPAQLNLSLPADQTKVYGMVMDMDMGPGTVTFTSFESGDASMYTSTGGGIIGGLSHADVVKAAKDFIIEAQNNLDKATKTDSTPLPDKDCVRFYFLTNKGKFVVQEQFKNIDKDMSPLMPLFNKGNKLITELRIIDQNK
ncbi:MAG: hypothetical protein ABI480_05360 [Chitinophagaceae bacterium]